MTAGCGNPRRPRKPDHLGGRAGPRDHSRRRHLLHEQHHDAHESRASDHEVQGPNWQLVSYAYDTLGDNDALTLQNGKNAYGAGSWASSLRYHDGIVLRHDVLQHHRQDPRLHNQRHRERPVEGNLLLARRCTTTRCSSTTTGAST